jgi:Lrp/AsnC family leucine-responsive transcriptional regulator
MRNKIMYDLDKTDRRIVAALEADGKLSYQELGAAVGLSAPAAFQRVRKLEATGVIKGYHARIDPAAGGRPLAAFVRLHPGPEADVAQLVARWHRSPAVVECHRITGAAQYLLKLRLDGVATLVAFLDSARKSGCTVESEVALETAFET